MDDRFRIFVEQLRNGQTETISESFEPLFLDIQEEELQFLDPVNIAGETYIAEDNLVVHFDIATDCQLPCSICNAPVKCKIEINGFYHAVPLDEVKSGIYNFKELLRETILLEIPYIAECNNGNCPQREQIEKFLKKEQNSEDSEADDDEGYRPFANLNFDDKE